VSGARRLLSGTGVLAGLLLFAGSGAVAEFRGEKTIVVSPELKVSIGEGDEITLSARPLPGEGIDAFIKRFTEDPRTKSEILSRNEGVKLLRDDVFVRVPYRLLSENYRRIAIEALFPGDSTDAQGWVHRVSALTGKPESLWRIAEWFTGDGANYMAIRKANPAQSLSTRKGDVIVIPKRLLTAAFGGEAEGKNGSTAATEIRESTDDPVERTTADEKSPQAAVEAVAVGAPSLT